MKIRVSKGGFQILTPESYELKKQRYSPQEYLYTVTLSVLL